MLDIAIIAILVLGLIIGFRRGFMSQIGGVIGILLGIIVCQVFAETLTNAYTSPTDTAQTRMLHNVLAYVVLFTACFLVGRLLSAVLRRTTNTLHLGFIDNIGGAIFKALEFMLGLSILLNIWIAVFPDTKVRTSNEAMTEFIVNFGPKVLGSETVSEIFDATSDAKDELIEIRDQHFADKSGEIETIETIEIDK